MLWTAVWRGVFSEECVSCDLMFTHGVLDIMAGNNGDLCGTYAEYSGFILHVQIFEFNIWLKDIRDTL